MYILYVNSIYTILRNAPLPFWAGPSSITSINGRDSMASIYWSYLPYISPIFVRPILVQGIYPQYIGGTYHIYIYKSYFCKAYGSGDMIYPQFLWPEIWNPNVPKHDF